MSARIGVQLVTYHNDADQLLRTLTAVEATVNKARRNHDIGRVAVRMGDCAERQWYTDDELARFAAAVPSAAFSYRFFDANLGSGGGSNRLAEGAEEDFTWVLNPDTYPAPSCLGELLVALAPDDVGAADARQIPLEHPKGYDPATGDTSWASGCCLLFDRTAFDAVGGFDPHFFPMYCDDVDLSWRMRLNGWRVVHAPRAVVFHDKRLDADGRPAASELEHQSGVMARLLLAHRYDRPDVVAETLEWARVSPLPAHRRAVDDYLARVAASDVPEPIAGAASVADFSTAYYGPFRFSY